MCLHLLKKRHCYLTDTKRPACQRCDVLMTLQEHEDISHIWHSKKLATFTFFHFQIDLALQPRIREWPTGR